MRDPLIDEARKAVRHFDLQTARIHAARAAKEHAALLPGAKQAELEIREAIRCLMMALPDAPTGTHALLAAALSPATRALSLSLQLRGIKLEVEAPAPGEREQARRPYYIEKD